MSLFNTDYNSGSSSTGNDDNDNDYEDRDALILSDYAIVSFSVSRLNAHTNDYSQRVFVDLDDVEVIHGMIYNRTWEGPDGIDDYEDNTKKVFGFGNWFDTNEDGTLAEEIQEKFINHRISETFGNNTFPYEFEELTTEDDEESVEMGNLSMKLKNQTKFRTFLKVLTTAGHDVIDDKEDNFSWVNENNMTLRSDLKGRRMIMFYKKETFVPDDPDEDEVDYTDAVILDEKTGAGITIQNGDGDSSSESEDDSKAEESASGTLGGNDGDDLPEGVPEEADEIIDFMARTEETERENVEQLVSGEADEYDLDAVIAEIENRM